MIKTSSSKVHILNLAEKNPARLLATLRGILEESGTHIRLELTGPGSVMPDTALMLFHELRNRRPSLHIHAHSHSCLFDGSILVWLASDSRSIRSDAWIQVTSIPDSPYQMRRSVRDYPGAVFAEESPHETDLRTIFAHMSEYLPVSEIAGLRVFPNDLCDLGILDAAGQPDPIADFINIGLQPAPIISGPAKKTRRPRAKKRGFGAA